MTNKIKFLPILLIILSIIALSSCGEGFSNRLSDADVDYLMSSYFILRGDESIPESRAAWNALKTPLEFPFGGETSVTSSPAANYPEKGQKTTATIETTDETGIYLVTNTTKYPRREKIISGTTESYHVKDEDVIGTFNSDDPLWNKTAGATDFNSRIAFQTEYQNGTIRYEMVEETTTEDLTEYAAIDIDGSLIYPETDSTPASGAANYSSMVRYIQEEGSDFSFWPENKIVIGARYYTEHGSNPTRPTRTSIAYEKIIKTDSAVTNIEDKISDYSARLFTDQSTDVTLAETVIRYEIQENGKKAVKTKTVIYDESGNIIATLDADYLEDEEGILESAGEAYVSYN